MATYHHEVQEVDDKFHGLELNHILRRHNEAADTLAKAASNRKPVPNGVFARDQYMPSIRLNDEPRELSVQEAAEVAEVMEVDRAPKTNLEDPDWRVPLLKWIVRGKLPPNMTEARRITRRAKSFTLIEGELYKETDRAP